jgi:hypothetical protein
MSDDAIAAGVAPLCVTHSKACLLRKSRKPGDDFGRSFWVTITLTPMLMLTHYFYDIHITPLHHDIDHDTSYAAIY